MVLINVKTYRHYFNDRVAVKTISQKDTDTNIKNILPSDVMGELDKFNVSFSLSYPDRENIEKWPTPDILKNSNIEDLFSSYIITSQHELNIRIRMNSYPTSNQLQATALPRGQVIMGENEVENEGDDGEAYGGGLRSSKRRKSKKRKSKRKSKRRSKKSKKRKSKTRRRSR